MIELTEGVVLKRIKYGDSSQVVQIFTRRFGLQSCMVKGIGKSKQGNRISNLLFPSSLVEVGLYYNEKKSMKYLRELNPDYICQTTHENIIKNCIAVFAVEVLQNIVIGEGIQEELFSFSKNFLVTLDKAEDVSFANWPLYFLVQAGRISGWQISGAYTEDTPFLNLNDGTFCAEEYLQSSGMTKELVGWISKINAANELAEIVSIQIPSSIRKQALQQFSRFYEIHLPAFKSLKSAEVFSVIFS